MFKRSKLLLDFFITDFKTALTEIRKLKVTCFFDKNITHSGIESWRRCTKTQPIRPFVLFMMRHPHPPTPYALRAW